MCCGAESKLADQNSILISIEHIRITTHTKSFTGGRKIGTIKDLLVEMAWGVISQHLMHFTMDEFANKSYRMAQIFHSLPSFRVAEEFCSINEQRLIRWSENQIRRKRQEWILSMLLQCSCAIKGNPIFSSLLLHLHFHKKQSNFQCLPYEKQGNSFSEHL